ncbi:MAG: thymidine kinase [Candidatus Sericytochromatia bacterium]|nr:thymidine kinase [Candidatus Sericytochromatia bacterium]
MFSGKSEELIRRVRRASIARQQVQAFKPAIDDRYHELAIATHAGGTIEAIAVDMAAEILVAVSPETSVVAIDEVQFFDDGILNVIRDLADAGKRVLVSGLDLDFRAEPFGIMPRLLAVAEYVDKLQAICVQCGSPATRTQRLINGEPAEWDDPVILVGAADHYEPRCRHCHQVTRRRPLATHA